MKKHNTKSRPTSAISGSTVNVYGSGPVPIGQRDRQCEPVRAPARQVSKVRFLPNTRKETVDSLLRYVSAFGQGTGSAHLVDGDWWIDLAFAEDAVMIRSQFHDLLVAPEEAYDECRL
ncbi:hypothetical protein [Nitratireductor sp. GCM10026969]|uniref:hypothetical protein n=1 Tax=Nitratireductor sp. GCM10026969 TaxID=3252645 RepID=UPI0036218754